MPLTVFSSVSIATVVAEIKPWNCVYTILKIDISMCLFRVNSLEKKNSQEFKHTQKTPSHMNDNDSMT